MLTPNSSATGMSTASPPSAASSSPLTSAAGAVHHGHSFAGSLGPGGVSAISEDSIEPELMR